jgi:trehalose synthase
MQKIDVGTVSPARLAPILGRERYDAFRALSVQTAERLRGRTVWNVSSTAVGGGVAEMLKMLVAYGLGAGVRTQWLVVDGDPEFFTITKRIHNRLHGSAGDAGDLGTFARDHYQSVLEGNLSLLLEVIRAGDVVILHDPQTAGLAAALAGHGTRVIWRCHVGADASNDYTDEAWSFLRPFCEEAHGLVFSRAQYAPGWVQQTRLSVIEPAIDPFSAKNMDMGVDVVRAVLGQTGIIAPADGSPEPTFQRTDGTIGTVRRPAEIIRDGGPPSADVPLIVQVSRWDRLKDMAGVLEAFARYVAPRGGPDGVHLALVGPSVAGVTDDPEGQQVLAQCAEAWGALPPDLRRQISLVSLPTADVEENATVVNAIQRHAAIVVQKSLAEGFGLTVAEAMWKSRPVVASAVGGIQDQIITGLNGLLVQDPTDLEEFGAALRQLLADPQECARLGAAARTRVTDRFLPDNELTQWAKAISKVDGS